MVTSGYYQVIPNSHMWSNIAMLLQWLKYQKEDCGVSTIKDRRELIEYLQVGLNNSLKEGYDIRTTECIADPTVKSPVYYRDSVYAAQTAPATSVGRIIKGEEDPNFNWRNY